MQAASRDKALPLLVKFFTVPAESKKVQEEGDPDIFHSAPIQTLRARTMRPSVRLLKPLEAPSLRGSRKALYVCSVCRQDASSCLPSSTQRRHASGSGSTPFTEKLRRRIWGTDNPPGLEDPYGGEGVIAKEWAKRKARYTGAKETSAETGQENVIQQRTEDEFQGENLLGEEFISAATAHDLPRIGHLSQWSDFPPTESDLYQPYVVEVPDLRRKK